MICHIYPFSVIRDWDENEETALRRSPSIDSSPHTIRALRDHNRHWGRISLCILPGRPVLSATCSLISDALFPDDHPVYDPGEEYLTTRLEDDWFIIKYVWWGLYDSGGRWTANVSLSTGVPSSIIWSYYHSPAIPLYIILTLVE